MASEIKSYALVQMPCFKASQECMEQSANETDSTVAKLFYQYVGLTLTAMEGVDKAACFAAEAVYDTPGTGSMMAWGLRALELVALSTVFSLSVSFALSIITTAIVFTIVFGVIGGALATAGGSVGFFLQGMRDMLLSGTEETEMDEKKGLEAVVLDDRETERMSGMIMDISLAPAGSNDSSSGENGGERTTPAPSSDNPWLNVMNASVAAFYQSETEGAGNQRERVAAQIDDPWRSSSGPNPYLDPMNTLAAAFSRSEIEDANPWDNTQTA